MKTVLRVIACVSLWSLGGCIFLGGPDNAIYRAKCPVMTGDAGRIPFQAVVFGVADRLHARRPEIRDGGSMGAWFAPMGWTLPSSSQGATRSGSILFSTHESSWVDDSNFAAVLLVSHPDKEDDVVKALRAAVETELKAQNCTWEYNYQMKLS
jgi:hypothetical protein